MNTKQRIITGVAAVAFLATLAFAPWDVLYPNDKHIYNFSPVWAAPDSGSHPTTIRFSVLAVWWFALAVLHTGAMFAFKSGNKVATIEIITPK